MINKGVRIVVDLCMGVRRPFPLSLHFSFHTHLDAIPGHTVRIHRHRFRSTFIKPIACYRSQCHIVPRRAIAILTRIAMSQWGAWASVSICIWLYLFNRFSFLSQFNWLSRGIHPADETFVPLNYSMYYTYYLFITLAQHIDVDTSQPIVVPSTMRRIKNCSSCRNTFVSSCEQMIMCLSHTKPNGCSTIESDIGDGSNSSHTWNSNNS